MKTFAAVALAVGVLISASAESSAPAATSSTARPVSRTVHPCKADFDKFCAGKVVCGKGACHDCLNAHMDRLDKACAKALEKWDEKQEEAVGK